MTAEPPPGAPTGGIGARVVTALNKLAIALRTDMQQRSADHALHPAQAQILTLLAPRPRGLRLGELASELGVTSATVSDSVTVLEQKGFVRRAPSSADRRAVQVSLTAAGRRTAASLREWPDIMVQAVDDLDPGEQVDLLRALIKMIRSLQERGAISPARMCVTCRYFEPDAHPGSDRPHHCHFVDEPFGHVDLRIDCVDHEPVARTG